jgi:hypothetical protein
VLARTVSVADSASWSSVTVADTACADGEGASSGLPKGASIDRAASVRCDLLRFGLAVHVTAEFRVQTEPIARPAATGFVRKVPGARTFRPLSPPVTTDLADAASVRATDHGQ